MTADVGSPPARVVPATAEHVLGTIAHLMTAGDQRAARVGSVTLLPHQREGAERVRRIMERHGGALLCDAVGVGKFCRQLVHVSSITRKPLEFTRLPGSALSSEKLELLPFLIFFSLHQSVVSKPSGDSPEDGSERAALRGVVSPSDRGAQSPGRSGDRPICRADFYRCPNLAPDKALGRVVPRHPTARRGAHDRARPPSTLATRQGGPRRGGAGRS